MILTELSQRVHAANIKWWQDVQTGEPIKRNKGELLCLVHSEVSEGFDGERTGAMDDKLPHRSMGEVEQADAFIRLLDYAAGFNHDIGTVALKFGVSEFIDLNQFTDCVRSEVVADFEERLENHGLMEIHAQISRVLEHERKGRLSEACEAIVELLIMVATYCKLNSYDLHGAFEEKMAFNATREDHKHEARRIAGGKQF